MSEEELTEVPVELDFAGPFSANELVEMQRVTGASLTDLGTGANAECIRAVAWTIGKRTNPALTLEQAGEVLVKLDG